MIEVKTLLMHYVKAIGGKFLGSEGHACARGVHGNELDDCLSP